MLITARQIKAARGLLDWTQDDLAQHAHLTVDQVRRFEAGKSQTVEILDAIERAFVGHGIEFIEEGVRRRRYEIRTLHGQKGFWDFYDDVYETIRDHGGEILVNNVDEDLFLKWLGPKKEEHRERMEKLTNFQQKIILKEGDHRFSTDFAAPQYRWAHASDFSPASFYLYGHKLAIVMFEDDTVSVFIIDQPKITQSYKALFKAAWDRATSPPERNS